MSLPQDINDREYRKFDDNGRVLVNPDILPTSGNNPSLVLGYTDGNLTSIQKTIGGTNYQKTLTYTNGVLTGVSEWIQL